MDAKSLVDRARPVLPEEFNFPDDPSFEETTIVNLTNETLRIFDPLEQRLVREIPPSGKQIQIRYEPEAWAGVACGARIFILRSIFPKKWRDEILDSPPGWFYLVPLEVAIAAPPEIHHKLLVMNPAVGAVIHKRTCRILGFIGLQRPPFQASCEPFPTD